MDKEIANRMLVAIRKFYLRNGRRKGGMTGKEILRESKITDKTPNDLRVEISFARMEYQKETKTGKSGCDVEVFRRGYNRFIVSNEKLVHSLCWKQVDKSEYRKIQQEIEERERNGHK